MATLKEFPAAIPIFPLPNVVFFPKTVLPLHIFEPRYRAMVTDALADHKLIGMVLLKKGWEKDYYGNPEVYDIGCVGKIQQTEKLEDGRYNIMLIGLRKIRIERFVQTKPYRLAAVRVIADKNLRKSPDTQARKTKLIDLYKAFLKEAAEEEVSGLDALSDLSLESLVNTITTALTISVYNRQELLEMSSIDARYQAITAIIQQQIQLLTAYKRFQYLSPKDPRQN